MAKSEARELAAAWLARSDRSIVEMKPEGDEWVVTHGKGDGPQDRLYVLEDGDIWPSVQRGQGYAQMLQQKRNKASEAPISDEGSN